jgi:hypothetical protein
MINVKPSKLNKACAQTTWGWGDGSQSVLVYVVYGADLTIRQFDNLQVDNSSDDSKSLSNSSDDFKSSDE